MGYIKVRGARTHNLKNVDVDIPRDQLVVITGMSGSGKSSLAFDTLYAEGQRRYVESLSPYARQFLELMGKADVDLIEGLSPAIAIEQKVSNRNPRSTVGTSTEINDYLRLLFARIGVPYCPHHNIPLSIHSISEMVDDVLAIPEETKIMVLAPIVKETQGTHQHLLNDLQVRGYTRVRIDGVMYQLPEWPELDAQCCHTIEVVVDRLKIRVDARQRIAESIEASLRLTKGIATVVDIDHNTERRFTDKFACPDCGYTVDVLEPKNFSFNSPQGSCRECSGLGLVEQFDPEKIVQFPDLSLSCGAIEGWDKRNKHNYPLLQALSEAMNFSLDTVWNELSDSVQKTVLYGTENTIAVTYEDGTGEKAVLEHPFEGIIPISERRYKNTDSETVKESYQRWRSLSKCPTCNGERLCEAARFTFIGEKEQKANFAKISSLSLAECFEYFQKLELIGSKAEIGKSIVEEIVNRLRFLLNVGIGYLTLDRRADTLSGGEAQRIRLAGQIGSRLTGVMYVLDEPSIGLHQVDNERLIETLKQLRDLGNSVIVVEHDEDTIRAADYVIDMGPAAGTHGGEITVQGTPKELEQNPKSLTGAYLSGKQTVCYSSKRLSPDGRCLTLHGATGHNLKNITVSFPVGLMTVVSGVSGSGKSSLINETLYPITARYLNRMMNVEALPYESIEGLEYFDKVINVDQSPIGKTPRSNPATYTGVFSAIRDLFAETPTAKERGYGPGRFSFNVKGGRCEACEGDGLIKVEMNFLPDLYVPCDVCHGNRYNRETLDVLYKGYNIAQVLDMTIESALELFSNVPAISRKLKTLVDVGLGYIKLGQSATTLSGGEAQRVKLAQELSKRSTGKTLYILDEPTTGLHFKDVDVLLGVLGQLRSAGNTLIIIEHNLDVIKAADWVIDIGPSGGDGGGQVVAEGTPEQVGTIPSSKTAKYLRNLEKR